MTECIRYCVDPILLNSGTPIDDLQKFNLRTFKIVEKSKKYRPKYKSSPILQPKPVRPIRNYTELRLNTAEYHAATSGYFIRIPSELRSHLGKTFRLINENNSYRLKVLAVVRGDFGYFV